MIETSSLRLFSTLPICFSCSSIRYLFKDFSIITHTTLLNSLVPSLSLKLFLEMFIKRFENEGFIFY